MLPTPLYEIDSSLRDSLRRWIGLLGTGLLLVVAAYRFAVGQDAAAWVDTGWALGLAGALAWRRWVGQPQVVGIAMAVVSMLASVVKIHLLGMAGLFWLFPVALGTFAVTGRGIAAGVSCAGIAYAATVPFGFGSIEAAASFAASALLILLIAWVSAEHFERLRQRLGDLATVDALTGAGNRRALDHALAQVTRTRSREPAALAVLDLDRFKQVNDAHGHAVGDRVLVDLAGLVRALLRPQDRLFRFGGEEFVVLMSNTARDDALGLLELLNVAVRQKIRVRSDPVTISAGLAMHVPGEDAEAWMARADAALYRAKAEGRDRVVEAAPSAPLN